MWRGYPKGGVSVTEGGCHGKRGVSVYQDQCSFSTADDRAALVSATSALASVSRLTSNINSRSPPFQFELVNLNSGYFDFQYGSDFKHPSLAEG